MVLKSMDEKTSHPLRLAGGPPLGTTPGDLTGGNYVGSPRRRSCTLIVPVRPRWSIVLDGESRRFQGGWGYGEPQGSGLLLMLLFFGTFDVHC
jgi:hypothetical protein